METAKQTGRTSFSEMAAFRAILVAKTDRLYRNLKDSVMLDELDVEVHLVKEGAILSGDSKSSGDGVNYQRAAAESCRVRKRCRSCDGFAALVAMVRWRLLAHNAVVIAVAHVLVSRMAAMYGGDPMASGFLASNSAITVVVAKRKGAVWWARVGTLVRCSIPGTR